MNEAGVASKIKEKNPAWLIKPISDKFGYGTPDRILLLKASGCVVWAELKFLKELPKNRCKVGLKPKQGAFLREWSEQGGNSCLIIGIGKLNKVAIFFEGFSKIANEGVEREEFLLVDYSSIGRILKERFLG